MDIKDKQVKVEHFQNLVAVAYADGHLEKHEIEYIASRAEDYGIEKETVDSIIDKAENLEFIIPLNDEDREEQLTDSVYMAMIDGQVHEKEYSLCLKIAEKLDFDKHYLDEIIDLTAKLWKGRV